MKNQTTPIYASPAHLKKIYLLVFLFSLLTIPKLVSSQDYTINRGTFSGWYTGGMRLCVVDKNEFYSSYTSSSRTMVRRYKNGAMADFGDNSSFPLCASAGDIVRDSINQIIYIAFLNSTYDTVYTYKYGASDGNWQLVTKLPKPGSYLIGYSIKLAFNAVSGTIFMTFCEQTSTKVYLYELVAGSWVNRTGATSITCDNNRFEITCNSAKVMVTTSPMSRLCIYSYDVNTTTLTSLNQNITNVAGFATTAYITNTDTYVSCFGQSAPWMGVKVVQAIGTAAFTDMTGTLSASMDNGSWGGFIVYNEVTDKLTMIFSSSNIRGYYWTGTDWSAISIPYMGSTNTFSVANYKDVYFVAWSGYTQIGIYSTNETPRRNTQSITTSATTSTCLVNFPQRGDGFKVALFVKKAASYDAPSIADNTTYTANAQYKSGTQLGTSGWYCVYNGVGESFTITGLDGNAAYQLQAFEYNGNAGFEKYSPVTAVTGNPVSFIASATLPVTWLRFTARTVNEKVVLNWSVSEEIQNEKFQIERSQDGIHFQVIGTVNSRNALTTTADYSFEDIQPLKGDSYYRLRQIDVDGRYSFSSIVKANMVSEIAFKHWMMPDGNTLRILVPDNGRSISLLNIFTVQGQKIKTKTLIAGWNDIDLQPVSRGLYIIQIVQEGQSVYSGKALK